MYVSDSVMLSTLWDESVSIVFDWSRYFTALVRTLPQSVLTLLISALCLSCSPAAWLDTSVVSTLDRRGNFKTVLEIAAQAELEEYLKTFGDDGVGFTLLAPPDEYLGGVDPSVLPPDQLLGLFAYHVLVGVHPLESLTSGNMVTLAGLQVSITVNDEGVKFDNSELVEGNILAGNGIIHAISGVMIPDISAPRITPSPSAAPVEAGMLETPAPVTVPTESPMTAAPTPMPVEPVEPTATEEPAVSGATSTMASMIAAATVLFGGAAVAWM